MIGDCPLLRRQRSSRSESTYHPRQNQRHVRSRPSRDEYCREKAGAAQAGSIVENTFAAWAVVLGVLLGGRGFLLSLFVSDMHFSRFGALFYSEYLRLFAANVLFWNRVVFSSTIERLEKARAVSRFWIRGSSHDCRLDDRHRHLRFAKLVFRFTI